MSRAGVCGLGLSVLFECGWVCLRAGYLCWCTSPDLDGPVSSSLSTEERGACGAQARECAASLASRPLCASAGWRFSAGGAPPPGLEEPFSLAVPAVGGGVPARAEGGRCLTRKAAELGQARLRGNPSPRLGRRGPQTRPAGRGNKCEAKRRSPLCSSLLSHSLTSHLA